MRASAPSPAHTITPSRSGIWDLVAIELSEMGGAPRLIWRSKESCAGASGGNTALNSGFVVDLSQISDFVSNYNQGSDLAQGNNIVSDLAQEEQPHNIEVTS